SYRFDVPTRDLLEELQPAREGLREALLLLAQHVADDALVLAQLRIGMAHLLDDDVAEPAQERRLETDPTRLQDRPPDNPAHDVAASLVRRHDAVRGEERHPT